MGRVIALELEDDLAATLRGALRTKLDAALEVTTVKAGIRSLQQSSEGIEALVLGVDVEQPVQAAQRAYAVATQLPVLLLARPHRTSDIYRALQFAPLIGENVRCVSADSNLIVAETIVATVSLARQRSRHQSTIAILNARLAAPAMTPPAPAQVLDQILQHAPIGIAVVDPMGRLTALNPHGSKLLGVTEHDSLGVSLARGFPATELARWDRLLGVLSQGEAVTETFQRGEGEYRARIELTAAPLTGRDGASGHVVLLRDVTENDRLIASLESARNEAEEADRTKDEFLAMLGHELRNPLSPIVTALELIRAKGFDAAFDRELAIIDRQVRHMLGMVEDLLDVSRITRGTVTLDTTPVELADIVRDALEQTAVLYAQRAHRIETRVAESGLVVAADRRRLTQVVANYLTNAAKYTAPGGLVTVEGNRIDDKIVLRVRDTGEGMPPALIDRIFEPFVQGSQSSDRSQGGLGLGLAIVRNLVTLHGGTVRATSDGAKKGSEFSLELPALTGTFAPPAMTPSPPEKTSVVNKCSLLLVDDNADAVDMLAMLLGRGGYEARVAYDAPQALALAEQRLPDIAVLDIGLPGMDGYELARRLRGLSLARPIRLIALSGYGTPEDIARAKDAGFDEHFVKPVNVAALKAFLAAAAADRAL